MEGFEDFTCSCMKKNSINKETKKKNQTFKCERTYRDFKPKRRLRNKNKN